MAKQKTNQFKDKVLITKLALSLLLTLSFLIVFFCFGGVDFLLGKTGVVKCFADNKVEVHFIDVGQGDCAFIRFPDNTNMLIDAGPASSSSQTVEYLSDLFRQEGISKIDRFLFTHQDSDHIGGAPDIFDAFCVDYVYRPKVYCKYEVQNFDNLQDFNTSTSDYYDKAIQSAYGQQNCTIHFSSAGIEWGNEDYNVQFLSPNKVKYSKSDNNSYSPIVRVEACNKVFLFTGDAESTSENEVIAACPQLLKADVLKVAHHGSNTSTSQQFLSYVQPEIAVISVGAANRYGHPTKETIDSLTQAGAKIYRTDQDGSIALSVQEGKIVKGGQSNQPKINLVVVAVVFAFGVLVIWGIKPVEKGKKKSK